ncbi:MAG: hypothetical protein ABI658_23300 [Acidimicrobiales bacterium]
MGQTEGSTKQDRIVGPKTSGGLTRGMGAFQTDSAGSSQRLCVDKPVSLVSQTTNNTCWAACTAMLLGSSEGDVIARGGDGARRCLSSMDRTE